MNKKILIGIGTLVIIALLVGIYFIQVYKPAIQEKKQLIERFSEFESQYQEKKAQGYDASAAEVFARKAKRAFDSKDYKMANGFLNNAFEALEKAEKIPPLPLEALEKAEMIPPLPETVKGEAEERLSRVEVASVYQRVTDGKGGRSVDDVIELLKEMNTDFIFRAWWRWIPCPESPENAPEEALELGYTYEHLKEAVIKIKKEMPNVIFCGAIPAQRINIEERNPITAETFGEEETWEMTLDPEKWGIDMSKADFEEALNEYTGGEITTGGKGSSHFPDITNSKFQELLLSWAKKQIDCEADAIWVDSLFSQALILKGITGDQNHPAVKESFEAASKIVDEIHNYGYSKGKYILVGTWPGFAELPYSPPNLDFVTMTPTKEEMLNEKLDEAHWDEEIDKVRNEMGNVPIFAFIDWAVADDAQLATYSQKLSKTEQREMLIAMDGFFQEKGVVFIYPLHGGFMGLNAKTLSYGIYDTYDSFAPEFDTGETIIESARNKSIEEK